MGCTIDHLRADHRVRVLRGFVDARGVVQRAEATGVIRDMGLDLNRREIWIDWEPGGAAAERMYFSLDAREGPGNGRMKQYFEVEERLPSPKAGAAAPQAATVIETSAAGGGRERSARGGRADRGGSVLELDAAGGSLVRDGGGVATQNERPTPSSLRSRRRCLGETAIDCGCDPGYFREVLLSGQEVSVRACLCCGRVTCTRCEGDDGRHTGKSSVAYFVVDVPDRVLEWVGRWPRVSVEYAAAPTRWPMPATLARWPRRYLPAGARCASLSALSAMEAGAVPVVRAGDVASKWREMELPGSSPPGGVPRELEGYLDIWESLQLRPESDVHKLVHLAQVGHPASAVATDLLCRRRDAFELMASALAGTDPVWRRAGYAMARDLNAPSDRLALLFRGLLAKLMTAPREAGTGQLESWYGVQALLGAIADQRLRDPGLLKELGAYRLELARHDADSLLVEAIGVVVRGATC